MPDDAYSGTRGWDVEPPTVEFLTAMRRALLALVDEACDGDLERAAAVLTDHGDRDAVKVIELARQEVVR